MEDRHNENRCVFAWQAENIVVFAMDHPKAGIEIRQVFYDALTIYHAFDTALDFGDIRADLCIAPLFLCVADYVAQIRFGGRRQHIA